MDNIIDCRSGNFKCILGTLSCSFPQISGQPASHVEETHNTGCKCLKPVAPISPGQYDLVIIGEMPGIEDDQLDMIWADRTGKQIIEFLKKAGHNLDRVWMTKIVKCRPRIRGRKPSVSELNICRTNYLKKEIELIQPKAVMLVGSQALKAFNLTGRGSVNTIHGRVFELRFAKEKGTKDSEHELQPVYKVIPTVNPATFFYKPNKKLQARIGHDYVVAKNVIEGKPIQEHFIPEYHLINTPEKLNWLKEKLLNSSMFGWDSEFCKLGFRKAPIISYQFAWGWNSDECAVLPIHQHDPNAPKEKEFHLKPSFGIENDELVTQFMKDVFLTSHIGKAGHNQKIDIEVLKWNYGIDIQGFLYDTWIMKHLMDENPPAELEFLCDLEFNWGDYSAERRKITGSGKKLKATFDKVPDEIMWPYGATDALGTYRLACLYNQRLQAKPNLWKFYIDESEQIQRSLAKAEYKGALVNKQVIELLKEKFEKNQNALLTKLRGTISKPDFNPNSPDQVLAAFLSMGVTNLDLEEKKNSSGVSTGKQKLNDLVAKGVEPAASFAANMITYRNTCKMIGTYIDNCLEDLDSDGRLRYSWVIAGPVTGRLSCRFFHQIPKIDEKIVCYGKNGAYVPFEQRLKDKRLVMRDMFVAPKGYKYVYGDFSQIELRILAIVSNDREMLLILSDPNGDLHTITTFEFLRSQWPDMTEADVTKFNRTEVGKRLNFGLSYGSQGHALVKKGKWQDRNGVERNFTWGMLNAGMAAWKERFKGVGQFIDITPDIVRSFGGTATNVFGRERHFGPLLNVPNDYERGEAERECINFFIQSVATSITNRTIVAVDKMLNQYGISEDIVCLVNTVHDSVAYEVRDDYVDWFKNALEIVSQVPYPELGGATFKIDCGVGDNWTDAEMRA